MGFCRAIRERRRMHSRARADRRASARPPPTLIRQLSLPLKVVVRVLVRGNTCPGRRAEIRWHRPCGGAFSGIGGRAPDRIVSSVRDERRDRTRAVPSGTPEEVEAHCGMAPWIPFALSGNGRGRRDHIRPFEAGERTLRRAFSVGPGRPWFHSAPSDHRRRRTWLAAHREPDVALSSCASTSSPMLGPFLVRIRFRPRLRTRRYAYHRARTRSPFGSKAADGAERGRRSTRAVPSPAREADVGRGQSSPAPGMNLAPGVQIAEVRGGPSGPSSGFMSATRRARGTLQKKKRTPAAEAPRSDLDEPARVAVALPEDASQASPVSARLEAHHANLSVEALVQL